MDLKDWWICLHLLIDMLLVLLSCHKIENAYDKTLMTAAVGGVHQIFYLCSQGFLFLHWIGLDWNALFRVNKIIEKNQINKCIIQVLSHINRYV